MCEPRKCGPIHYLVVGPPWAATSRLPFVYNWHASRLVCYMQTLGDLSVSCCFCYLVLANQAMQGTPHLLMMWIIVFSEALASIFAMQHLPSPLLISALVLKSMSFRSFSSLANSFELLIRDASMFQFLCSQRSCAPSPVPRLSRDGAWLAGLAHQVFFFWDTEASWAPDFML